MLSCCYDKLNLGGLSTKVESKTLCHKLKAPANAATDQKTSQ